MFQARKRKVSRLLPIVAVIGLAGLVYLFFFNQGFALSEELQVTPSGLGVYAFNHSSHEINNIGFRYIDQWGRQAYIDDVPSLLPGEEYLVELSPEHVVDDTVTLFVTAQYHQPTLRIYPLGSLSFVRLQPTISAPEAVLLDDDLMVRVKVCNQGMALDSLSIRPRVSGNSVQSLTESRSFPLEEGQCREAGFDFKAQQLGSSTIYFNVLALSYSEEFSINLRVIENA